MLKPLATPPAQHLPTDFSGTGAGAISDEADTQRAVCQHLTARPAHGLVWFHPANGGWRHHVEAARFVGLGVKPGVADLILLHNGRFHALELKAHGKSKVSKAQKQFIADVKQAGGEAEIAFGLDHALRVLERWQLLRGRMV
jgi:hypothetical protein